MSTGGGMFSGAPYTASVPAGQTIQVPLMLYNNGKYVWQNDPAANTLTGIYQGTVATGSAGKIRICGADAWGCGTLTAGQYTVTLQNSGTTDITASVLIRPWTFSDYWNFAFSVFGITLWGNKYPSTC